MVMRRIVDEIVVDDVVLSGEGVGFEVDTRLCSPGYCEYHYTAQEER